MLLIAGQPLKEKYVKYGPFVVENEEQLFQAFDDYRKGKNGFEGAREWSSEIRHLSKKGKKN